MENIVLTSKASNGYSFSSWSNNDSSIKIAAKYSTETTAQVNGPGTVKANFTPAKQVREFPGALALLLSLFVAMLLVAFLTRPHEPQLSSETG